MKLCTLCFLVPAVACTAALVNYTIDDKYGDSTTGITPAYLPGDAWAEGDVCSSCNLYPANLGHTPAGSLSGAPVDTAQVFNGTWHDTTYFPGRLPRNITVQFVGQAVYVFNIIANIVPYTSTNTTLVFSLDDKIVGQYVHPADPFGPELMYNVAVYTNHSIPHDNHTLVISTKAEGTESSLVLFDYVVYTADDLASPLPPAPITTVQTSSSSFTSTPPTQSPPPTPTTTFLQSTSPHSPFVSAVSPSLPHRNPAVIIGITAAGSIVGTILLGLVATFIHRKCKRRARKTHARCRNPGAIPTRPDTITVPTTSSPLHAHTHAKQPASPSDDFSHAATRPNSRRTRSLSDLTQGPGAPPTDRHSGRVRLFAKIVAKSPPRVSHPVHPRADTIPPTATNSSPARNHREAGSRGRTDGLGRTGLRRALSGVGGRLRAEVAGLREEIELFRESELAIYSVPVWVPPPYRRGQVAAPGVEAQPDPVAP